MKLRLTHNSIRIRIQRSELAHLQEKGQVVESISFPSHIALQFELTIQETPEVRAFFEESRLTLALPDKVARSWMNTNQVGIESQIPLEGGEHLHVLIEKDFPCADRPNEDKSETFWELVEKSEKNC